jgi:hypothetical protein
MTPVRVDGEAALSGRMATAAVLARGTTAPGGAEGAAAARAWLVLAESARADGELDTASTAAMAGIDALGDAYVQPDASVEDSSRLRLWAADAATDPAHRATVRTRTLEDRLVMFGWRHADQGVAFDPPVTGEEDEGAGA